MAILIVTAKPLIVVLLTDKWLECVLYFQILCVGGMLYSTNSNNMNILKALGQGKSILYVSIIKRAITFAFIVIGIRFGIYGIICGSVLSVYLWFPTNAYYAGKLTGYGFSKQVKDISGNFILALSVGCVVFFGFRFLDVGNDYILIVSQVLTYFIVYVVIAHLFRIEGYLIYYNITKDAFWRSNK